MAFVYVSHNLATYCGSGVVISSTAELIDGLRGRRETRKTVIFCTAHTGTSRT